MGGREKQSQDGNDEKVSVIQRGRRHGRVRLRLLWRPAAYGTQRRGSACGTGPWLNVRHRLLLFGGGKQG